MDNLKQRHGCVSAWLWIVAFANLGLSIYYVAEMFNSSVEKSEILPIGILSILCLCNVLSSILLMRWNKCGFYLFVMASLAAIAVNVAILKLGIQTVSQSLIGVVIWFAILQIKKNGVSAWSQMENGWDYKHCRHLYQVFGLVAIVLLILSFVASSSSPQPPELPSNDYSFLDDEGNSDTDQETEANKEAAPSDTNELVEVKWKQYTSSDQSCSIDAPNNFTETQMSDDQVLGLVCTDSDPAIVVIQESASSMQSIDIHSSKDYAETIIKRIKESSDKSFKILSKEPYGDDSYLIVYELTVKGTLFKYNVLATHADSYYYYCQIYCIGEYANKLQPTMSRMLSSFKALK